MLGVNLKLHLKPIIFISKVDLKTILCLNFDDGVGDLLFAFQQWIETYLSKKKCCMYPCDNYSTKVLIFSTFAVFSGNYSCLQVALEWRRDLSQYWSDLFLPDMVLVATSFLTFWLDWSSVPARAILGMYYFIWTA